MADAKVYLIIFFLTTNNLWVVGAWDSIDLELFDLVEEIKDNFYEVLGVKQVGFGRHIRTKLYHFMIHICCVWVSDKQRLCLLLLLLLVFFSIIVLRKRHKILLYFLNSHWSGSEIRGQESLTLCHLLKTSSPLICPTGISNRLTWERITS